MAWSPCIRLNFLSTWLAALYFYMMACRSPDNKDEWGADICSQPPFIVLFQMSVFWPSFYWQSADLQIKIQCCRPGRGEVQAYMSVQHLAETFLLQRDWSRVTHHDYISKVSVKYGSCILRIFTYVCRFLAGQKIPGEFLFMHVIDEKF